MNKSEKLICLLLGAILAWYIFFGMPKKDAQSQTPALAPQAEAVAPSVASTVTAPQAAEKNTVVTQAENTVPEKIVSLENDDVRLEISTWGAVVKKATLKKYARDCGEISDENPALVLDFSAAALGAVEGVAGLAVNSPYEVKEVSSNSVTLACAALTRKITLGADYKIEVEDNFAVADATRQNTLSLGAMAMGNGKNDSLSLDSWTVDSDGGKVIHHCEGDSPFKAYLVGGLGGCGGSKDATGLAPSVTLPYNGAQKWIAIKNRFFVSALVSSTEANGGFTATIDRDLASQSYRPSAVSAKALFAGVPAKRTSVFYVGPKKQALLWPLGMKDVMEFGMWRWVCYPMVYLLNFFNDFIPNYGIAIILLTILVRIIFWPLTHKSTVGMKKMQEIQPKMKEIQAKYKDNPQRMQQEVWALYRTEKVNPMSSCLPMLVQIPVFIALFNVLRSTVELRYAPFLWIADLSEPEALFKAWFPFGGLNILPILMAATMALQSALTPSTGDKNQQRMMMVFMPIMMLFMFYSFPSALSLYWTLSQVFSIWQMWLIRHQTQKKSETIMPEVIDPPQTRQMRRHG